MLTQSYTLSLQPGAIPTRVPCTQADNLARTLTFQLTDQGANFTPPTGSTITMEGTKPDGHSFSALCTLSDGLVSVNLTQQMTAVAGDVPCQLTITKSGETIGTARFFLCVEASALPQDADLSASDLSAMTELRNTVVAAKESAAASASSASASASAAATTLADKADKNAGLWRFSDIPDNADLNDYTACGYYTHKRSVTTSTIANCPVSISFTMKVFNAIGDIDSDVITGNTWQYRIQRLTTTAGDEYIRSADTDGTGAVTFTGWKKIFHSATAPVNITAGKVVDYNKTTQTIGISQNGDAVTSDTLAALAGFTTDGNIKNVPWSVAKSKLQTYTEGTSGNWKFRKWESGFKEAWYRGPLTTSIDADGGGGIYFKSGLSVDYPFAYDAAPMVNISVTAPGVMVWPVVAAETDTSSVYFYLVSNSSRAAQVYYVNLYIAG